MRCSMPAPQYFDYRGAARDAGITDDQLRLIEQMFRADYPTDDMLFELHVLRVCLSVKEGRTDLARVLREIEEWRANAA